MGIWIRSQDKCTLINVNKIQIADFHNMYKNAIWGDDILLGIYLSKEKALKVLDMIEQALTGIINVENIELSKLEILKEELKQKPAISTKPLKDLEYKIHNREFVFQMPDDEVKENE